MTLKSLLWKRVFIFKLTQHFSHPSFLRWSVGSAPRDYLVLAQSPESVNN